MKLRTLLPGCYADAMKVVGRRRLSDDTADLAPADALRRAWALQQQAEQLHPYPRPRGFVFKARTRAEYERWRRRQPNPRLW